MERAQFPSHCEILFSLPNSPQKPLRGSVWSVISVWKVIACRSSTTHDLSYQLYYIVTKKWGTSCTSKVLAKCKGFVWILDCEYEQEIIAMLDTISKIIKWVMNWEIKISLIIWHRIMVKRFPFFYVFEINVLCSQRLYLFNIFFLYIFWKKYMLFKNNCSIFFLFQKSIWNLLYHVILQKSF